MDIQSHPCEARPGVEVVAISGRLDTGTADDALNVMSEAMERSAAGIIIDIGGMEFVSSAGLRILLMTGKKANALQKKMAIVRSRPQVYKIFKISALDKVLAFFDSEPEALQALWP